MNYITIIGEKALWARRFFAVLRYGFQEMNLNRIEAIIDPANTSSVQLLENFDFVREGLLREYDLGQNGFDDVFMYAILKRDYE